MVAALPAKTASIFQQRLPSRLLVLWIFAFIVAGVMKHKLMFAGAPSLDLSLFNRFSILEVIGAYCVVRLALRIPPTETVSAATALASVSVIALLIGLLQYRPGYASGGLEIWLLLLSIRSPALRPVALGVTLFVFQYLLFTGPFLWLHEAVGQMDAAVLRSGLLELGYGVGGFGPIIVAPDGKHGVNVMGTCSSSQVIGTVGVGYLLIVLGRRDRLAGSDWTWLGFLLCATLILNWVRLAPMALSPEGHAYWHDGDGAGLVALAYAAATIGVALAATRDVDPAR